MKTLLIAVVIFLCVLTTAAQETVTVTLDDLKILRKAAADRDYWEKAYNESERQKQAAIGSAANWEKLFLSEKNRADNIQGGRITETQGAVKDLQDANKELHAQAERDRVKIGELTAENNKLRSERKYIAGLSFAGGVVAGWWLKGKSANVTNPFARSEAQMQLLKPIGSVDFTNKMPTTVKF